MKCEHAQEFFSDYIEASLDKPSMVSLEAHLMACASCREGVEGLRQTWTALKAVPEIEPPKDLAWRVLTQLQQERAERLEAERKRTNPFFGWLQSLTPGAAFGYAVVVALLFIGLVFSVTHKLQGGPTITFMPSLGRGHVVEPQMAAPMISPLAARQDPQTGLWYYPLVVTPPDNPAASEIRVAPVASNGQEIATAALSSHLVAGHSQELRVPVTVPEGPVKAVSVRVWAAGWRPYVKQVDLSTPNQRPGF